MRVRWQFFFEYEDLKFEKKHTYVVNVPKGDAEKFGLPAKDIEATVTIEPDEEKFGHIKQSGKINIFLPGSNVETENLAYSLAQSLEQQITFHQSKIKIIGSFISNELIPETKEEEEELGENRFSWTIQVQEVPPEVSFDGSLTNKLTNNPLLIQFNTANEAQNPIDKFIGLFKILEDSFGGQPIKVSFRNSINLQQIALRCIKIKEKNIVRAITQAEFEKLVDDLVDTRHQCTHLRSTNNFGITYGDTRVNEIVKPLLIPLEILAFEIVKEKIS